MFTLVGYVLYNVGAYMLHETCISEHMICYSKKVNLRLFT